MDQALVDNWNSKVRPQDHGYLLGDIAMKKPALHNVRRLNGHLRMIGGNHDIFNTADYLKAGFEKVMAMRVIDRILFAHIPIHPASMGRFRAQVHGHIHNNPGYGWPYINISAEEINYTPISFDEIEAKISLEESYRATTGDTSPLPTASYPVDDVATSYELDDK